ncbi:MAG TPA: hypothetical protein VGW57_02370 [Chthoniobacterales bacterium]|nr:hypothetical protein [Chthoniobacterales bacterium]
MISRDPFVTNSRDFDVLGARAAEIFHTDRRLPAQVFATGFDNFAFLEFDVMLFREFWNVLALCAETFGDEDVSLIVHEPDPDAYYFTNFQRYGALDFKPSANAGDYKQAFLTEPPGSPADALQYVAAVVSWFGSSRKWGFWGERDFGVAVAATRDSSKSWPQVQGIRRSGTRARTTSDIRPGETELVTAVA